MKLFLLFGVSCSISLLVGKMGYDFIHHRIELARKPQYVSVIDKNFLAFPPTDTLKYYYEPTSHSTQTDQVDWLPYTATYTLNDEGLNSSSNYALNKLSNTFRIITLGDSFTFGHYVNTKDNYPSQLETILKASECGKKINFEVLNLGVPGYDIQYAVERFALHGQKYNPDLVLWLINEHNLLQLREIITPLQEKYEQTTTETDKQKYLASGHYYYAASLATREFNETYGQANVFAQQQKFLQRFSSLYSKKLGVFMFTSAPENMKEIMRQYQHTRNSSDFFGEIPDVVGTQNALPDYHPSAQGHKMIATHIYDYLVQQKVLPCN